MKCFDSAATKLRQGNMMLCYNYPKFVNDIDSVRFLCKTDKDLSKTDSYIRRP